MRTRRFKHLGDRDLLRTLSSAVANEWTSTATVVALIAEVDERKLYLPAGHPSMYSFCVHVLHLSEDAALKRIQAARAAQQFPAILEALADGRLHLTAVGLLAPHLTRENADELLKAATHQTKSEVELLLAQRFPRSELLPLVRAIPASTPPSAVLAADAPGQDRSSADQHAPAHVQTPSRRQLAPLAAQRFELDIAIGKDTHDKLNYAKALLGHRVSTGDLAVVIDLALDALIAQLERRKFAATTKPRARSCSSTNPRHVPAHVKRAVRERDQGQCAFVSESGQRCSSRQNLEYDHIDPVARGGKATIENVRLVCRAHNQYEAERMFGAGFMNEKREQARRAAAEARTPANGPVEAPAEAQTRTQTAESKARKLAAEAEAHSRALAREYARDVMTGLRELGFRADQSRRAAEFSETLRDLTLEERMRAALKFLCPAPHSRAANGVETAA